MKGVMIWSNLKLQMLFSFLHWKQTSQASSLLSVFSWGEQPDSNFCKYTSAGLWEVLRTAEEWVTLLLSLLHWGYCSCQILPFTWKTSQRSFHIPDCHPSLSPLPPPSGSCRTASFHCPAEIDLSWVKLPDPWRRKEGKQTPSNIKPAPIPTPNLEYYPFVPSYCCILSWHEFLVESCLYNLWALLEQPNFTSIKYYDCIDFHHKSYFPSSVSLSLHWLN